MGWSWKNMHLIGGLRHFKVVCRVVQMFCHDSLIPSSCLVYVLGLVIWQLPLSLSWSWLERKVVKMVGASDQPFLQSNYSHLVDVFALQGSEQSSCSKKTSFFGSGTSAAVCVHWKPANNVCLNLKSGSNC